MFLKNLESTNALALLDVKCQVRSLVTQQEVEIAKMCALCKLVFFAGLGCAMLWMQCYQLRRENCFRAKITDHSLPPITKIGPLAVIKEGPDDFEHLVLSNSANSRSIKIFCPGVRSGDIAVRKVPNGASVAISLKNRPSQDDGVSAPNVWKKTFTFPPEGRLFELEEDQLGLKQGILTLLLVASEEEEHVVQPISGHSQLLQCECYNMADESGYSMTYSGSSVSPFNCPQVKLSEDSGSRTDGVCSNQDWFRLGEPLADQNYLSDC